MTAAQPTALRGAPLAAIVGLAGAVRAGCWAYKADIFNDGPTFIELAQLLQQGRIGEVIAHPYHPLYSLAIAGVQPLVGDWDQAGVIVSILSGCAAVMFLHHFIASAFDRPTADLAALILAVHPWAVRFSSDIQSDGLYMAAFLASVALLWDAWKFQRCGVAFAAGVLSGVAYWVRPEGVGVAMIGGALGVAGAGFGNWKARRAFRWVVALALGTTLTMAPLLIALRVETGTWMITQKKSAAAFLGFHESTAPVRPNPGKRLRAPAPPPVNAPPPAPANAPRVSRSAEVAFVLAKRASSAYRRDLLIFLGFGIAALWGPPSPRAWFVLAFVGCYAALLIALYLNAGYVSRRHVLPPLLLTFGYAAAGLRPGGRALLGALRRVARKPPLPPRCAQSKGVLFGTAIVLVFALSVDFARLREDQLAVRRAAEWLSGHVEFSQPVAARRLRVAYHARAPFVPLPNPDLESLVVYLKRHSVRYMVIDEERARVYPELRDPGRFGIKRIYRVDAAGRTAAVFELTVKTPTKAYEVE